MERALILLAAALLVYVAPGIQGTSHLSFANATISPVNITRDGCAATKLCVETPNDCDPTGNNSCLFASVTAAAPVAPNGSRLSIELRGDSMGYIALGLTVNASMAEYFGRSSMSICRMKYHFSSMFEARTRCHIAGTTMLFVCAQNNGSFFFRTMARSNTNTDMALVGTERRVMEIRGKVMGNVIMCEFDIPNVNASERVGADTTFTVLLGSGTTTGTDLGAFNITLNSGPLDLSDPTSNVANSGILSAYPHAVLPLLSILSMVVVLKA